MPTIDTLAQNRERSKRWYAERKHDPEFLAERAAYGREFRKNNPEKRLLQGARNRAAKYGLPIDIDLEDIVIPDMCPVLGVPFERSTQYAASLDRITPSLGYVKGNIQVISRKANAMKQDATDEELRRFAQWVLKL